MPRKVWIFGMIIFIPRYLADRPLKTILQSSYNKKYYGEHLEELAAYKAVYFRKNKVEIRQKRQAKEAADCGAAKDCRRKYRRDRLPKFAQYQRDFRERQKNNVS